MRTAEFISLYVGALVGLGYLIGSLTRFQMHGRGASPRALLAVEIVITMLWAAVSFAVIDRVAPGTSAFRNSSAVGFLSSKALTVWESAALWSGLATLVGFAAPAFNKARNGSSGFGGAGALLFTYSPISLLAAGVTFVAASAFGRSSRAGTVGGAAGFATSEWILSMLDIRTGWGFISGPETSLWALVMAGVLVAASLRSAGEVAPTGGDQ